MEPSLQGSVELGLKKESDFTAQVHAVTDQAQKQAWKLREAPGWAKELVLTDWVSMACTAPIIAGLTVYVVYLWQAQQNFHDILNLMDASGGLTSWITAYAVFLAVTLPLVVIILAWVLGLLIYTLRTHTAVQRDAVASVAFQPKRYKAFRWLLVMLMAIEYIGLLWLIAQLVATAILLVAAYGLEAAATTTTELYNSAWDSYQAGAASVNQTLTQLSQLPYNATVAVNGSQVSVAGALDTAMLKVFDVNRTSSLKQRVQNSKMNPPCPDFCINLAFFNNMLGLNEGSTCICSPDSVVEMGSLAADSKDQLVAAIVGIILMIVPWVILLMRLAATHDVVRVKHLLQQWLVASGYGPHGAGTPPSCGSGVLTPSSDSALMAAMPAGPPEGLPSSQAAPRAAAAAAASDVESGRAVPGSEERAPATKAGLRAKVGRLAAWCPGRHHK
ncbi:hypothetical protein N2152v2_006844 [Parachlorella kessleri]